MHVAMDHVLTGIRNHKSNWFNMTALIIFHLQPSPQTNHSEGGAVSIEAK